MKETHPTLEGTQERIRYNAGFREKQPKDNHDVCQEMVFKGYASEYRYTCVHNVVKTVCVYPKRFDASGDPLKLVYSPARYSHQSNVFFWVKVAEMPRINEEDPLNPDYVLCAPRISGEKHSMPVPMQMIHADVLPSILPGDDIYVQAMLIIDTFSIRRPTEGEDQPENVHMTDRTFMSYMSLVHENVIPRRRREQVFIHAKIIQVFYIRKKWNDGPRTVSFTLSTAYGIVDAIALEDKLTDEDISKCKRGNYIDIVGWITVNPAIEEYQQGAIWDEEHLKRLFEDCNRMGRFWRLTNALSNTCSLIVDGCLTHRNRSTVINALENQFDILEGPFRMVSKSEIQVRNREIVAIKLST